MVHLPAAYIGSNYFASSFIIGESSKEGSREVNKVMYRFMDTRDGA